jgi:hypothetical protein
MTHVVSMTHYAKEQQLLRMLNYLQPNCATTGSRWQQQQQQLLERYRHL